MNEYPPMKTCTRCGLQKPLEDFPVNMTCGTNHASICRKCVSKMKRRRPSWRDCIIPSEQSEN